MRRYDAHAYGERDWHLEFDEEQYVTQAGSTLSRLFARPGVRADWEAALANARELVRPAAAWDAFPIQELRHERLVLAAARGTRIGGGPVAAVVAGATDLVVGVCTVGGAISQRISEQLRGEQRLRAMFLDDLGSWAVDKSASNCAARSKATRQVAGCTPAHHSRPASPSGRSPNRL